MTSFVLLIMMVCIGWEAHLRIPEFMGDYNSYNWCDGYGTWRQQGACITSKSCFKTSSKLV